MLITVRLRHPLTAATLALALVTAGLLLVSTAARAAGYAPHEVIVGYAPPAQMRTAEARSTAARRGAATAARGVRTVAVRLPAHETVSEALARLRHQPGVAFAEPDFIARAAGTASADPTSTTSRSPDLGRMQWNLLPSTGVNAPQAWANLLADHRAGGRGVVVAVLDTGVAYRSWKSFHRSPDFAGTRFVSPRDFIAGNRYPLDRNGHGTFVAGLVAQSSAQAGLTGLAYGVSIMPIRVLDASGEGDELTIARGIRYAVAHGAQVINLSLEFLPTQVTSTSEIPAIVSAVRYAHDRGVAVVGAAGNDQSDQIAYPARAPDVISVGATTRDRCLADYSNGGSGLDLVAPGGGDDAILLSDPDCHPERSLPSIRQLTLVDPPHWNRFGYPNDYMGTSMSTPEVSATAALVIASGVIGRHPTPDQILAQLERTATPLGGSQPNTLYGYGLVNAGAATAAVAPEPSTS